MPSWARLASSSPYDTQINAARARAIVMDQERQLGFEPIDREREKLGYDIESRVPRTDKLRFIEVKGRVTGSKAITVTRNELHTGLDNANDYILALVEFFNNGEYRVYYLYHPFQRELDSEVFSLNYGFAKLIARAMPPG
ncbi:MAG: DUF3883 domain-containing protein [Anaerolineae bacterium]|nr:DUF3883 domain-containing protein [Anaerolineae bacterium]